MNSISIRISWIWRINEKCMNWNIVKWSLMWHQFYLILIRDHKNSGHSDNSRCWQRWLCFHVWVCRDARKWNCDISSGFHYLHELSLKGLLFWTEIEWKETERESGRTFAGLEKVIQIDPNDVCKRVKASPYPWLTFANTSKPWSCRQLIDAFVSKLSHASFLFSVKNERLYLVWKSIVLLLSTGKI